MRWKVIDYKFNILMKKKKPPSQTNLVVPKALYVCIMGEMILGPLRIVACSPYSLIFLNWISIYEDHLLRLKVLNSEMNSLLRPVAK